MDIRFQARPKTGKGERAEWQADALIVLAFKGEEPLAGAGGLAERAPWLEISPGLRDFRGGKDESALLYGHPDLPVSRALFAGLGRREAFKAQTLREAVGEAVKRLAGLKIRQLAVAVDNLALLPGQTLKNLEETVLAASLALYDYREYKSGQGCGPEQDEDAPFVPDALSLLFSEEFVPDDARAAARAAEAVACGICRARDLINGPANVVTPARLEEAARELAGLRGFGFTSYDPERLRREGFGALLAVAQGSEAEPRLLVLEHAPRGKEKERPVVIVGKGVTFDSGGLSLKPSAGMEKMKRDMAGAGTVLGLFTAIGALGGDIGRRVVGIMPCAENMPGGRAVRPGDIVRTLSGKTVEVTNTDAEGRLLLCDALTLAQNMEKPAALIDIATLTGACVVALGEKTAGVFGNDKALCDRILALAEETGERMWPLPIFDQDLDMLKSMSADLANVGPREGGASFAALFLKQFVQAGTPWAHLDIAGPAYHKTDGGATAFGLRTLFEFISRE